MNAPSRNTMIAFAVGAALSLVVYLAMWRTVRKSMPAVNNHMVKVDGYLDVKDSMRIGSLVEGIVKEMHVKENDPVTKGQLIVEIDDGKDDTEVRQGRAAWDRAKAKLTYTEKFYRRQKALYCGEYISDDAMDLAQQDYDQAQADVELTRGAYDKAQLDFDNKSIKAPDSGLVLQKVAREGETVAVTSPATILYIIAKDLKHMQAFLQIPETVVSHVKPGMKVQLNYAAFPDEIFEGEVVDVSHAGLVKEGYVGYRAVVPVDNSSGRFNPGMTLHAHITID